MTPFARNPGKSRAQRGSPVEKWSRRGDGGGGRRALLAVGPGALGRSRRGRQNTRSRVQFTVEIGLERAAQDSRAVDGGCGPSLRRASQISYCLSVNFGHSFHLNNRSGNGMRLAVKMALVLLVLGGAMYLFVFPARTYLDQKQGIVAEQRTVAVLRAEDSKLTSESSAFRTTPLSNRSLARSTALSNRANRRLWCCPHPITPSRRAPPPPKHAAWYSSLEFWHNL